MAFVIENSAVAGGVSPSIVSKGVRFPGQVRIRNKETDHSIRVSLSNTMADGGVLIPPGGVVEFGGPIPVSGTTNPNLWFFTDKPGSAEFEIAYWN